MMFLSPFYKLPVLLSETGISNLFNSGTTTSRSISEGWDNQWINLLQNNTTNSLYRSLTNLGIFFAVGTLIFFIFQWIRDVIENEYSRPLSALIWPFVVVILLTNMGKESTLANLTLGVRNFLNTINQQVIITTDSNQNYQQVLSMSVAEEVAGALLRPCQSLTGDQQTKCLVKSSEKINILWQEYRNLYGDKVWISRLENRVNQATYRTGNISEISFNTLLGSTVQTSIKSFFISLQYAFQNLLEATMLLIAALGPIAVGASLLPGTGKPIFAWLTGFLAIGIAKISFNIMAISTATVIMNGPGQNANADPDLLWFMIFLGILAPITALGLATLGGFAVFNAMSNTTIWVRNKI
jgi:hypothetical protein